MDSERDSRLKIYKLSFLFCDFDKNKSTPQMSIALFIASAFMFIAWRNLSRNNFFKEIIVSVFQL